MRLKTILPATLAVWVWLLVYDNFLAGILAGSALSQIPGMMAEYSKMWEIIGDLFMAGVFVWFYDLARSSFPVGLMPGIKFGFLAGIFLHFPTWLWLSVYLGWSYGAMWHLTLILILVSTVNGAIAGMVLEKTGAGRAA